MASHYHHDFWRGREGKKGKKLKPNDNKTPGLNDKIYFTDYELVFISSFHVQLDRLDNSWHPYCIHRDHELLSVMD